MKKRVVGRNLLNTGAHWYFSDPYIDEYTNMECPSCKRLIHFGVETCPYCDAEINEDSAELRDAQKRKTINTAAGILFILFLLAVVIFTK